MVVLGGVADSYERGTPGVMSVESLVMKVDGMTARYQTGCEPRTAFVPPYDRRRGLL